MSAVPGRAQGGLVSAAVVVLAKEPVPGRVKTRLTSAYTPAEAAELAAAALADTLDVVASWPGARPLCVLAGQPGPWLPAGVPVRAQAAGGLGTRIAAAMHAAFDLLGGPVLLVGMDTPQLTHEHLDAAVAALRSHDAVLGPAVDGGWWLLGLRAPQDAAITGVPTSRSDTGARQRAALLAAGLTVADLPPLVDVDTPADAATVAAAVPAGRFARALARVGRAA